MFPDVASRAASWSCRAPSWHITNHIAWRAAPRWPTSNRRRTYCPPIR